MIFLSMDNVKVQNDDWLQADYCPLSKLSGERILLRSYSRSQERHLFHPLAPNIVCIWCTRDVQNAEMLHNYELLFCRPHLNSSPLPITAGMQFCHQRVNITRVSNIHTHLYKYIYMFIQPVTYFGCMPLLDQTSVIPYS